MIPDGWTYIIASAWINSVNTTIGAVGMFISSRALNSLNCIEKTQPRIMCATSNGNPRTIIVSFYGHTNASNETGITTFYNGLSSLEWHIPKHNVLIIGRDMNAQIGKDGNNKFCSHNMLKRNGPYLEDFSLVNRHGCLLKFQKRKESYESTQNNTQLDSWTKSG